MGKKLWKKKSVLLLSALLLAVLFTACGSASGYDAPAELAQETYDTGYLNEADFKTESVAEEADEGAYEEVEIDENAAVSDRKLIKNVNLDVETEDYPRLVTQVQNRVSELGGYVEQLSSYNENSVGNRRCSMTLRIPAAMLDSFIDKMGEISNIVSRQESVEDVTLQYVDMESHKKMLQEEQQRLLELMEKAETMEDIISIESRLTEVRYQLESMESQLRTMDNRISYSTVWLYISEVERYTPPEETGTWDRIRIGFSENVYRVGRGLIEFLIGFIISLPILVLIAVVIVVAVLILKLVIHLAEKNNKRKKGKKAGQTSEPMINPPAAAPTETKDTDKSDEEKQ